MNIYFLYVFFIYEYIFLYEVSCINETLGNETDFVMSVNLFLACLL